jgi:tetratricopeptide (TPR) repeat protein
MALKEKLIDKAQKLIQKGYLDKAIVEYRAAADADPRDISIRLRIGDLYVKLNKKAEAIKEYTEAARANAQRGFYLKAIAVYKQILKLEENLETHNKLAELYLKQRLIADAVGEYSYIVHWYESRGKTSEVLELLKKMADIDPENIGVRLKLADLYQKLSFGKDALAEYSVIFEKLLSAGKLDKAEKVYLTLYHANPSEERVLSGLSELYRLRGDDAQRLKYLKGLFNHYSGAGLDEEARRAAQEIIRISPDDPHASRFLKKDEKTGPQFVKSSSESEPLSIASSIEVPVEAVEQKASGQSVAAWPEEEIEITIEGFEVESGTAQSAEAPVQAPPAEKVHAAPAPPDAGVHQASADAGEIEIDIDDLLKGELPQIVAPAASPEPPTDAVELPVEESKSEAVDTEAREPIEETGIEEAISVISAELREDEVPAPEASPYADETPVEVSEPLIHVEEIMEAMENVEAAQPAVETAAEPEEPIIEIETEPALQEVSGLASQAMDEGASVELIEINEERLQIEEAPAEASAASVELQSPGPAAKMEEVEAEAEEELQEDLSSAIQELMEKMDEPEEAAAPVEEPVTEAPATHEEYVDLSAELGMEEASKDIAGSWGDKESAETFDEFKNGIGKQLSKEDSETHYNLGIAYMEMELYGEASKEFKIALKDSRLELDCYTRLGLCAMAEKNHDEAAAYYAKGLKAPERSIDERKALMYELALAYEAAGRDEESMELFREIFAMDPEFREAGAKVSSFALTRPMVPLDDGFIEVELL